MSLSFDRYLDPDETATALAELAAAWPEHARLESLGTSYEGRDLPLLVLTDIRTGPDTDKPALWVSGNIHAIEVAGAMAALHVAWTLLTDSTARALLEHATVYIAPCLAPDGAARVFHRPGDLVLSGPRPYPDAEPAAGLRAGDVDGDGRVLTMRVKDRNGSFAVSDEDPRLMVRRDPDAIGGDYYLLLPEGAIDGYDGHTIPSADNGMGLNFNRNFPADWAPETEEAGAGPFPLSEPETRAVADFIAAHPNICAAMDYHTYSGIHLRPFGGRDDSEMPLDDLRVFRAMGERATATTGYPAVSVWHGFRYHPTKGMRGSFLDWLYQHRGIFAWTTELWDMCRAAGVERKDFVAWHEEHPIEDDLAMLRWNDDVLGGRGFVDWYPIEHPQLGPVELGGWDRLFVWNNPPPELLRSELERNTPFTVFLAAILPRLDLRAIDVTCAGDGTWRVAVAVDNAGFLPSYGSEQALAIAAADAVVATLSGADVVDGPAVREVGKLRGRDAGERFGGIGPTSPMTFRGRVEWTCRASAGSTVRIEVGGSRCGRVTTEVVLDG